MSEDLPFTGERYVPSIGDNTFLEHMHRYLVAARFVADKDVLDIASGEGFGSNILSKTARSVIGVDVAEEAVIHARSHYRNARLRFETGSATSIPLADGSVDVVVSFETSEHIAEQEEMLTEIKRVLRPSGILIIATPDKATHSDATNYGNPYHVRELYRDEFHNLLSNQFAHVRMHGQKIGFSSLIVAEDAETPFVEIASTTSKTTNGVAEPMYLIGFASDDPTAISGISSLFTQDIQASDPMQVRVQFEIEQATRAFEAKIENLQRTHQVQLDIVMQDIDWISHEIATLQRGNWMSTAPFFKLLRRMIKIRMLYALSRVRIFPKRRKARFLKSAEKRDPMLLSRRLDHFVKEYSVRMANNSVLGDMVRQKLMNFAMSVTVVVPNYNHARFLRKRLDSILGQTYPLINIVILDDCSTDDSRAVIEEYVAKYPSLVKAVFNDQNSGSVFAQWQRGYEIATGDLVWFCESDDFCETDFLERLVPYFRDPSVMLAFGKIEFADAGGSFMPGMAHYLEGAEPGIWDQPTVRPAAAWLKNAFGVKNVIANVGGSLWRRASLKPADWTAARQYRIMGDWYLYSVLAKGGQIAYDPMAVAYFRIHGQNTSGNSAQAKPEYYHEYMKLMSDIKRRWPIPNETIERFVENCRSIYSGAGIKSPPFSELMSADALKSVETEVPHVLMGILGFSYGGGEIFPIHLANALARQGVTVSMLQMMDTEDHPSVRAMLDSSIPVYTANTVRDKGGKAFIEEIGVSIVHSHIASIEMLLLDKAQVDLPYLSTLHGSYEAMEINQRKITSWASKVDRYAYTADKNLRAFDGISVPRDKFMKLSNAMPVDERAFRRSRADMQIPRDAVVFTLVARGIDGKGWIESVKAYQTLRARRPDVVMALLAVGEGPQTIAARELAGNDPSIHFVGYDDAIHGIYRLSDVALIPTRFPGESFPLCLIQAMQVGVPAVATDHGEIKSMLQRNGLEAGLTVPFIRDDDDFIEALVDAMDKVLDPETRRRLAADAATLGSEYDIDRLATKYLSIYKNILSLR